MFKGDQNSHLFMRESLQEICIIILVCLAVVRSDSNEQTCWLLVEVRIPVTQGCTLPPQQAPSLNSGGILQAHMTASPHHPVIAPTISHLPPYRNNCLQLAHSKTENNPCYWLPSCSVNGGHSKMGWCQLNFTSFAVPYAQDGASLVAQLVKNPPVMQETRVQFQGWKDPLEKGKATH